MIGLVEERYGIDARDVAFDCRSSCPNSTSPYSKYAD